RTVGRDRLRVALGRMAPTTIVVGAIVIGTRVLVDHLRCQATRLVKKSPNPVATSMMPEPMDLNTSAAEAGRKARKKMRNAMPPQVRIFLPIPGYPPLCGA